MRTTLTLDDNLLRKLKDLAHSQTKKFKHVVNETLSPGPAGQEKRGKRRKKFTVKPFSGGFRRVSIRKSSTRHWMIWMPKTLRFFSDCAEKNWPFAGLFQAGLVSLVTRLGKTDNLSVLPRIGCARCGEIVGRVAARPTTSHPNSIKLFRFEPP
jgi:hypothetical protein